MKKILPISILVIAMSLVGCNPSSNPTTNTPSEDPTHNPTTAPTVTPPQTGFNYSREYKTQLMIEKTIDNSIKDDKGILFRTNKNTNSNFVTPKQYQNENNNTSTEYELTYENVYVTDRRTPEIKSISEPLSFAFGMIEYFTQHNITDLSPLETSFYNKYSARIFNEETLEFEDGYRYSPHLIIRDFPHLEEKVFFISYWTYNNLIHIHDDGQVSMLSNYIGEIGYVTDSKGKVIGYDKTRSFSIGIQTDGYSFHKSFKGTDLENNVDSIKESFNGLAEEYKIDNISFLINTYFDMYKQEDGTYDLTYLTDIGRGYNPDDPSHIDVNTLTMHGDSYLFHGILTSAFMHKNYGLSYMDPESFYRIEDGVFKELKKNTYIIEVPNTVHTIEYALSKFEETPVDDKWGYGIVIPSSVTTILEGAFNPTVNRQITHIFVDMLKEECPFASYLESLDINVYYQNEYTEIGKVPVPLEPHWNGDLDVNDKPQEDPTTEPTVDPTVDPTTDPTFIPTVEEPTVEPTVEEPSTSNEEPTQGGETTSSTTVGPITTKEDNTVVRPTTV